MIATTLKHCFHVVQAVDQILDTKQPISGPLPDEIMLFVLEATKIDHHWSSLKQDGSVRRRILAPAVVVSDFRSAATLEHAEQIKEPLQSSNAHWCTVFYQLGGIDDLEQFLKWGTDRVLV